MDQNVIDLILISIAGFVAVYSLVRLMQVYRQRLVFETREIVYARMGVDLPEDGEEGAESS